VSLARIKRTRPAVGIGGRGEAIVAWSTGTHVEARAATSSKGFGPVRVVGSVDNDYVIAPAIASGGRAAVAWYSRQVDDAEAGGPAGPAQVRVAYANRDEPFGAPVTVDCGDLIGPPQLAFDSARKAVVAWTSATTIRVSEFGADGATAPTDVAASGGEPVDLQRVATGADGAAVVLWLAGDVAFTDAPTHLRASLRRAREFAFGAAEPVTPDDEDVYSGDVAIDPRGERATAVWPRALGGTRGRVVESSHMNLR
jgi:hypothetical protein